MKRLVVILSALLNVPAAADIIYFKDGTHVEGDVKKTAGGYVITDSKGATATFAESQIAAIELVAPKTTSAAVATANLASLRRAMEHQTDIKLVIQRYQEFLTKNANTPAADEAKKDVELWKERLDKGLVRYGDKWMDPAERDRALGELLIEVDKARGLLKEGRLRDADAVLQKVLALDARNASALYLRGVVFYRQDQLGQARKAFETVNTLTPNHAPALNNLAVILWRQNQFPAAIGYYEQALNAGPPNKEILNNVAEALQAVPANYRDHAATKRLLRRFQEQDTQLQQEMSKAGLYRWGATWVSQQQLEALKKAEQEIKTKLDAMSADFDATQERITRIDDEIQTNNRYMQSVENTNYGTDPATGQAFRLPLPQAYFDVQRDTARLKASREEQVRKLDQLRASAKQIQQRLPTPRFTGLQQLIGPEGTPLKLPPEADKPATNPSVATTNPTSLPSTAKAVSPPPPELLAGPFLPSTQPTSRPTEDAKTGAQN